MNWFLTPTSGLILAAAVIPPLILLYFLKLRRKPQAIASTLLWKRSVEDLRANAPFQKLRRSILLFLQLLTLLLLALAVMQPQLLGGRRADGRTVMMIDNSASMTATDEEDGRSRLEVAKEQARGLIEQIYSGGLFADASEETMIISFAETGEVLKRFTSSKPQLLEAIGRIQPTHERTRIGEALKLARAYTINPDPETDRQVGEPATIELFSDGRIHDLGEQVLRGEELNYHAIGTVDADNVALSGISIERPFDRPTAVEVFASLVNYKPEPVICDVQISVDGAAIGVQAISVEPASLDDRTRQLVPGRNNVIFQPFEQPRGAVIEIANLRPDALAADNVVQLVVPPPRKLRVAIVNQQTRFIQNALARWPLESMELMTGERFNELAEGGTLDRYDVFIFDNFAPATLPDGRYLTLGRTPPVEGLNEYGEGEFQVILTTRDDHPVLQFVALDNLRIAAFKRLQPADDIEVLAEGSSGPAIVAVSRGPLQVIHVTFDPLDSNWPFLRSYANFIVNAVDYLGHAGEALATKGFSPGQAIATRLPGAASDIEMLTPDGQTDAVSSLNPAAFSWGPARLSGLHVLSWTEPEEDGRQVRPFAVNLLSEEEGNVANVPQLVVGQETVSGEATGSSSYTPLWPYAIAACLALLMVEWWIYHRKAYI